MKDNIETKVGRDLLFHREKKSQKMENFYPICEMKSDKSDFIKRPLGEDYLAQRRKGAKGRRAEDKKVRRSEG